MAEPPKKIHEAMLMGGFSVPRWMGLILVLCAWLIAIPFAHGLIPWMVSTLVPRHGWTDAHPAIWNWLGLVVVAVAVGLLAWILFIGIIHTPKRIRLGLTPSVLVMRGPYAFTRNPMYVAELGLWLGWAI